MVNGNKMIFQLIILIGTTQGMHLCAVLYFEADADTLKGGGVCYKHRYKKRLVGVKEWVRLSDPPANGPLQCVSRCYAISSCHAVKIHTSGICEIGLTANSSKSAYIPETLKGCPKGFGYMFQSAHSKNIKDVPSCYTTNRNELAIHSKAQTICRMQNATILAIESNEELMHVKEMIRFWSNSSTNVPRYYWLSASYKLHRSAWVWDSSGQPLEYKNWEVGEPFSQITMQCALMDSIGAWATAFCGTEAYGIICESTVFPGND